MPALDPVPQAVLRGSFALLLLVSARPKIVDFPAFREALANYRLLPSRLVGPAALLLVGIELCLAIGLVASGSASACAAATSALLALYGAAIAVNLARGRRAIDCGCAGPGQRRELSEGMVLRNALLSGAALLAALPVAMRVLVWLDVVTIAAGVGVAAMLYAASDAALENAPRLRAARERRWPTP